MSLWLSRIIAFFARLFLGPVIAQDAGRAEAAAAARIDQLTETVKTQHAQAEIAARPLSRRDDLLKRMRDGDL